MKYERVLVLQGKMKMVLQDFKEKRPAVSLLKMAKHSGISGQTFYAIMGEKNTPSQATCMAIVKEMARYGYNVEQELWGNESNA